MSRMQTLIKLLRQGDPAANRMIAENKAATGPWYDAFHGTTKDKTARMPEIRLERGDPRGWLGNPFYATTSPTDAGENYAKSAQLFGERGPDLDHRIKSEVDFLMSDPDMLEAMYGVTPEAFDDMLTELIVKKMSRGEPIGSPRDEIFEKIVGDQYDPGQSNIMPLSVRYENPVEFGGRYGNAPATQYDLMLDRDQLMEGFEHIGEGDLGETILDDLMHVPSFSQRDIPGLASADRLRRALVENTGDTMLAKDFFFEGLGHDAAILNDAKKEFIGMPNIPEGTKHIMVPDAAQVRSRFALFNPEDRGKAGLLLGAGGVIPGGLMQQALRGELDDGA